MSDKPYALPCHDFKPSGGDDLGFEIISYDRMSAASRSMSLTHRPHRHSFYEILYYTAGEGTHFIDFTPFPFRPPVLYFISPGQVHFWDRMESGQGTVLLFTQDFILNAVAERNFIYELAFFHNMLEKPELRLTARQQPEIESLLDAIQAEYAHDRYGRVSMLRSYLRILLVQVQRMYATQTDTRKTGVSADASLVRRFKQFISTSRAHGRSIDVIAGHLGVSPSRLNKTIKAVTGRTPGQLIRDEVALEAKRLLAHTEMSAAEIAYALGFDDPSYFGRFFKRESGLRPSEFRRHSQEKYHFFHG